MRARESERESERERVGWRERIRVWFKVEGLGRYLERELEEDAGAGGLDYQSARGVR